METLSIRTASAGILFLLLPLAACQEDLVTDVEGDLIPIDAVTVESRLPFSEFAQDLQVWGGYGRPYQLTETIVARGFGDILDVRTVAGLSRYPLNASVRDTLGTTRTDTLLTFVGGRLVARIDTVTSVYDGPVTLAVGAIQNDWDYRSVSWTLAVDSVGDTQTWPEAGAGPVIPVGTGVWDPEESDSLFLELDSAGVAIWADTAAARRGLRLDALTDGVRLDLESLSLVLTTRPSLNPDTLIELTVGSVGRTFVYTPELEAPEDELRVGGVPAWRSVLRVDLPRTLDGPPELCAVVVCPLTLTAESLISASLVLHTKAPPVAFQPTDSVWVDVRQVLEPSRLPKSPIGASLVGLFGTKLSPGDFGDQDGVEVNLPLGRFIDSLIRARDDPDQDVAETIALLSTFEPLSLNFLSFYGPDSPLGPELRLILTIGEEVRIR
jgi:hypothetical protein